MPINFATVSSVNPVVRRGNQAWISWVPATTGLTWQVYINGVMHPAGLATGLWVVLPPTGPSRVVIGSVDVADADTDFSADLPASPQRRVTLAWQGGAFQSLDLVGFRVYGSSSPAGFGTGGFGDGPFGTGEAGVDYTAPLETIPAFPGGLTNGTFGAGGFGSGGFGGPPGDYSWTSGPLASGAWQFAIVAYDSAGNTSTPATQIATIAVPPAEPTGLQYSFDGFGYGPFGGDGYGDLGFGMDDFGGGVPFGGSVLTLSWTASTG